MLSIIPFLVIAAFFFRNRAIKIIRVQRGDICIDEDLKNVFTVTQWEQKRRNSSNGRQKSIKCEYDLKSSLLTLFVICVTWSLGTLQAIFLWGMAIPFGTMYFLQGLIYISMYMLRDFCQPLNKLLP